MLVQLSGRNFGCFRDEFCLSMLAADIEKGSHRGIIEAEIEDDPEPLRLLRIAALYGPNASGKSTIIRAAKVLGAVIRESVHYSSDEVIQSYNPFALSDARTAPSFLAVKAVVAQQVYDYEVEFNSTEFVYEKLVRWEQEKQVVLFERRTGLPLEGEWMQDEQFRLLFREFRKNALVLSLADSLAPGVAKGIASGLKSVLRTHDLAPDAMFAPRRMRFTNVADRVAEDEGFRGWLTQQLIAADVGIGDVHVSEHKAKDLPRDVLLQLFLKQGPEGVLAQKSKKLTLLHHGIDGLQPLPPDKESLGTQRLIRVSPLIYDLTHGTRMKTSFIDEFDASLHPALLERLVRHFNERPIDRNVGGQLIMAVHETGLIDGEASEAALRRDQVYFTQKDRNGAARLYALSDFKERQNINMRRRYLQGRYGALPALGDFGD